MADDQFRVTSLSRQSPKASAQLEEEYRPEIVEQHQVKGTSGDTWTGLTPVDSYVGFMTLLQHELGSCAHARG